MTDNVIPMIILKGEPKTSSVKHIQPAQNGLYRVTFANNRTYNYRGDQVEVISKYKDYNVNDCRIYREGILLHNVVLLRRFYGNNGCYYRVIYGDSSYGEYYGASIAIASNCLKEKIVGHVFSYLKSVASINDLRPSEADDSILLNYYNKLGFIEDRSALACFLDSKQHEVKKRNAGFIIYPFGCNGSQKEAVENAFSSSMSVIQGPPGTGKTQTILNIIANIVMRKGSILMVSNSNMATLNVSEKLEKYGLGFLVAKLGKRENKELFLSQQKDVPWEVSSWRLSPVREAKCRSMVTDTLKKLGKAFKIQEEEAKLRQERYDLDLEWQHFRKDINLGDISEDFKRANSEQVLFLWTFLQQQAEGSLKRNPNIFVRMKLRWLKRKCSRRWGIMVVSDDEDMSSVLLELRVLYYRNRLAEIDKRHSTVVRELKALKVETLKDTLTDSSLLLLRSTIARLYSGRRPHFNNFDEIRNSGREFFKQYPVVLSTTFSATTCVPNGYLYDYVIMDEASQISLESGALALSCAQNAVIVGDSLQLPCVITEGARVKLKKIRMDYDIPDCFDARKSLLQSVCEAVPDALQTLLREHYRCHPKIIGFCNQKFYGGRLVIMTHDNGEKDVLSVVKTVGGNHASNHYNQREIDVIKWEVLPSLRMQDFEDSDIGIVTPYNNQVNEFNNQIHRIECATVHKYQGREKDAIIMSVVDNQISSFTDDPNMLNVAVSRAKKRFCLVVNGNQQNRDGNIQALLDYIEYNNCSVTESSVRSIFDYLYGQYTTKRMEMLKTRSKVSEYDSENLTYAMLSDIVRENIFSRYTILCHTPLREIFNDSVMFSEDKEAYVSHPGSYVDFLVVDRVTHKPVLGIETDGYTCHKKGTAQYGLGIKKTVIFLNNGLPLLHLSTKGSGEKEKIRWALMCIDNGNTESLLNQLRTLQY